MKFRFKVVNGDEEFFTEWKDDTSVLVAGTKEPPSPVRAVTELRQLYPDAALSLEQSETDMPEKERDAIRARWMKSEQ